MIILSIDVGVRNFSFVIIEVYHIDKKTMTPEIKIFDWNNLNIVQDYSNLTYLRSEIKKMTLSKLKEVCVFHNLDVDGNLKKNYIESINFFLKKNKISKSKYVPSLADIGEGIRKSLNNIFMNMRKLKIDVDYIILENQPKINQQMKTVQIMLYTILFMNKENINQKSPSPILECVSPSLKSKFCDLYLKNNSCLETYRDRKRTSIKLVQNLIQPCVLCSFDCWSGKKDDLSDVVVQALGFALTRKNANPTHYESTSY